MSASPISPLDVSSESGTWINSKQFTAFFLSHLVEGYFWTVFLKLSCPKMVLLTEELSNGIKLALSFFGPHTTLQALALLCSSDCSVNRFQKLALVFVVTFCTSVNVFSIYYSERLTVLFCSHPHLPVSSAQLVETAYKPELSDSSFPDDAGFFRCLLLFSHRQFLISLCFNCHLHTCYSHTPAGSTWLWLSDSQPRGRQWWSSIHPNIDLSPSLPQSGPPRILCARNLRLGLPPPLLALLSFQLSSNSLLNSASSSQHCQCRSSGPHYCLTTCLQAFISTPLRAEQGHEFKGRIQGSCQPKAKEKMGWGRVVWQPVARRSKYNSREEVWQQSPV